MHAQRLVEGEREGARERGKAASHIKMQRQAACAARQVAGTATLHRAPEVGVVQELAGQLDRRLLGMGKGGGLVWGNPHMDTSPTRV